MWAWRASAALAPFACALVLVTSAFAAFPGQNGKIAFTDGSRTYSINADGSGPTQLTSDSGLAPAWSPDGQRLAFVSLREGPSEIWAMNADGSGEVRLTDNTSHNAGPGWSPDGSKILWSNDALGTYDVWAMNPDGTGQVKIGGSDTEDDTGPVMSPDGSRIAFERGGRVWLMDPDGTDELMLAVGSSPDWSPDGTKLTFSRTQSVGCSNDPVQEVPVSQIFRMNADGTGITQLTHSGAFSCESAPQNNSPVWSPDGTRIAWSVFTQSFSTSIDPDDQLLTMDANGTNVHSLGQLKAAPDWQPVQPGYARPKGATPFRASLVPAYIGCGVANATHGAPLTFGSCTPPAQRSSVLTTGTPDANGATAGMVGSATLNVLPGDVSVSVRVTDVRCLTTNAACPGGPLSDYTGRLLALPVTLRITDHSNTPPGPAGVPGTGDTQLVQIPVDCAATAGTAVGSTCQVSTTVDSLLPGAITAGRRANWELGQFHVRDAGPNGTGYGPGCPPTCGDGDETLFLREGVFVP